MRVAVIPGDITGCGTYRMILPANAVMKARPGWEVELYEPGSVQIGSGPQGELLGLKGIADPHGLDILVMQRVGMKPALNFTIWAQEHGIATVIDSDDAMWCIDKDNVAHKAWNSRDLNWRTLDQAMKRADLVTCTTPYIARRYGDHGRVEVIDNYLPEEVFGYRSIRDEYPDTVAVGWAGFVDTHPQDLQVVGDAVSRAVADTGVIPRVVADARGAARAWGLTEIESIRPQQLGEPYFSALSAIDIALVPLTDTPFNRGKSWLKAIEFGAMGVPSIVSPTPDYLRLAKEGVPLLFASTPDEWYDQLVHLINHPEERVSMGARARMVIQEKLTIEAHGEQWAQAWERAFNRRRKLDGAIAYVRS